MAKGNRGGFVHGHAPKGKRSRTYSSWWAMISRCRNPLTPYYEIYGGAGITVCERWREFPNFLADMGERPPGRTLDRYPNGQGDYEPGNCRWATVSEQLLNRCVTRNIEFQGEVRPLMDWCAALGIPHGTVRTRIRRGWEPTRALSAPIAYRRTP